MTVAVTSAVNMDMIFIPVIIHIKQNSRPGRDFGDLSPYLTRYQIKIDMHLVFGKLPLRSRVDSIQISTREYDVLFLLNFYV